MFSHRLGCTSENLGTLWIAENVGKGPDLTFKTDQKCRSIYFTAEKQLRQITGTPDRCICFIRMDGIF